VIDVNDLRKGVTFELDGGVYRVMEFAHHKPGRGTATIRTKIRDLRSGTVLEKTFISGDRVQDVRLDYRMVQFLYREDDLFHFMDTETYEQPTLGRSILEDSASYLKDGVTVKLTLYESEPLEVELPTTVDLLVTESEPGSRATATGATKLTTETGLRSPCPLRRRGRHDRVDTRSGTYVTRV
jgi:elongation factor P